LRKISFVLLALFLFGVKQAAAETSKPYRIGTSLGYSFTGYREETYSPVNRYLNTLTFIIDGNIEKRNFLHSFNLGFYMGNSTMAASEEAVLFQDYDPLTGEAFYSTVLPQYLAMRGYLEYALDYLFWGNNTFPGYLGGAFRADTYLQFANYPSITGLVSLNIHATQKWNINSENSITVSLGFPFFGYAVRPPYAGADAALMKYASEEPVKILTLGEITSLHNHWAVYGDVAYQHVINSLVSLYSGLGFELSRINFPRPRRDAILRLNSGIAFSF
jgi:hypothetical protein